MWPSALGMLRNRPCQLPGEARILKAKGTTPSGSLTCHAVDIGNADVWVARVYRNCPLGVVLRFSPRDVRSIVVLRYQILDVFHIVVVPRLAVRAFSETAQPRLDAQVALDRRRDQVFVHVLVPLRIFCHVRKLAEFFSLTCLVR